MITCHQRNFSIIPKSCRYDIIYLALAFVGRTISDVGDRRTPGYRREWQKSFRPKGIDIFWIWKIFGFEITVGSWQ
jgi:hypothetical protein